jgi:hypothetical protein
LLIYLNERLKQLKVAFWEFGSNIPEEYKENITNKEMLYLENYKKNILDHSQTLAQTFGFQNFDLTKVNSKKLFPKTKISPKLTPS